MIQVFLTLHVVDAHVVLAMTVPAPHSSSLARPTLSEALAATTMLLPVHTLLAGEVIDTVGGVVSLVVPLDPLLVAFETVTARVAVAVPPAESVTVAVRVTPPLALVAVFQPKEPLVPVKIVELPAFTTYVYPLPLPPLAATETVTVPLTVAPLAGLVKLTLGADGVVVPVPPELPPVLPVLPLPVSTDSANRSA